MTPMCPPSLSTVHVVYECHFSYSIILDLHFPSICYRKLLTPPVVPANDDTTGGFPIEIKTKIRYHIICCYNFIR